MTRSPNASFILLAWDDFQRHTVVCALPKPMKTDSVRLTRSKPCMNKTPTSGAAKCARAGSFETKLQVNCGEEMKNRQETLLWEQKHVVPNQLLQCAKKT